MNFRFAVISDPHIALPQTIWTHPNRFHLVEVSIPALQLVLDRLVNLDLDFILLPGDLTQDGEPENHAWLRDCLASLPFPAYVIPGNHDVLTPLPGPGNIGLHQFPQYYQAFGYTNPGQLYYCREILPGVQLIGLNSNNFDGAGKQIGYVDEEQLQWLAALLPTLKNGLILVMIHHNVIEHLPGQSEHELGKRYMLNNAGEVLTLLKQYGVKLIFTGHLHVQDIAYQEGIYEITTGSLVSYPHPYRVIDVTQDRDNNITLNIQSDRVESVEGWETLAHKSRQWMADRSFPFMLRLLTSHPLNLPADEAEKLAPSLRYFWSDVAAGDNYFDFDHFPPHVREYFRSFSAIDEGGNPQPIDNNTSLVIDYL
ncbi:MAG: 3',5'-cyclic adenosine monophosphate phosphodiesterase CpdA [Chroococcopsis gigantea SAG 12.99]|jgi:3',5'-cyclic AMP phosphodiesterase CpdA|nr:3',5'-cyclic adenosine monophosphate phosphodiesterase CpdA [Chroococcopsis gigantea SAG 12.99]